MSSRKGSTGGNSDIDPSSFGKLDQVSHGTLAAFFAVVWIEGYPVGAFMVLKAMWKQKQNSLRGNTSGFPHALKGRKTYNHSLRSKSLLTQEPGKGFQNMVC